LLGLRILFNLDESGASLTWKYLHAYNEATGLPQVDPRRADADLPVFYQYVRDRDLWQWQLPDSKAISLAYRLVQKQFLASGDFVSIENFALELEQPEGYARIVTEGRAMQRYADALVEEQAARATKGVIGGYTVPIVNATTLFSEVGDYLCTTQLEIPFCAYWFVRSDGMIQVGLRGRGEIDLSLVAQQYGGGGHKQAAGFVLTVTAWEAIYGRGRMGA
jgi:oligoribonuclease NrnB/cAMP/cGMP phosphodiesterase (DHH superfamily)